MPLPLKRARPVFSRLASASLFPSRVCRPLSCTQGPTHPPGSTVHCSSVSVRAQISQELSEPLVEQVVSASFPRTRTLLGFSGIFARNLHSYDPLMASCCRGLGPVRNCLPARSHEPHTSQESGAVTVWRGGRRCDVAAHRPLLSGVPLTAGQLTSRHPSSGLPLNLRHYFQRGGSRLYSSAASRWHLSAVLEDEWTGSPPAEGRSHSTANGTPSPSQGKINGGSSLSAAGLRGINGVSNGTPLNGSTQAGAPLAGAPLNGSTADRTEKSNDVARTPGPPPGEPGTKEDAPQAPDLPLPLQETAAFSAFTAASAAASTAPSSASAAASTAPSAASAAVSTAPSAASHPEPPAPESAPEAAELHTPAAAAKTERRRKNSQPDLLTVPGVGPRNLLKLVASGIGEVAALTRVYREKSERKDQDGMDAMVEYLRRQVGVRRDHAMLISTYAKARAEMEEGGADSDDSAAQRRRSKRLTFCVEGNISVGKSTFLRRVAGELLKLHEFVEVVPEPIAQWQDVGPQHLNLLHQFYDDPQKYAYTFQNYVFVTRVMQSLNTQQGPQPLRIMERSIFSDRMVFVRAVHEAKWLDDTQLSVYDSSFDPFVQHLPGLVPDAFIYLRAFPEICHERLQRRARAEENTVSLDYLSSLHEKHEGWLFPHLHPHSHPHQQHQHQHQQRLQAHLRAQAFQGGGAGGLPILPSLGHLESGVLVNGTAQRVLRVEEDWPRDLGRTPIPPKLQGRVFGIGGEDIHPSIRNVPALVLDCNSHIDFNISPEHVNWYAEDILEFFNFVKNMKEAPEKAPPGAASPQSSLILPGQPNGSLSSEHSQLFKG